MTRIALLADLHFGTVPAGLAEQLRLELVRAEPDVIVVAGDLTMRSRTREFTESKAWLASLTAPLMLLPGNHDLPVWNVFERFTNPFARYAKATGAPLMPVFEDPECFVLGLNTTASWHPHFQWQEGIARRGDVLAAQKLLAAAPAAKLRIVATHHPLFKVAGLPRARPARRFEQALDMMAREKVEVLMHGHLHQQYALRCLHGETQFLTVGAPTALSSRVRGEPNGYWLIEATRDRVVLTLHYLNEGGVFATREPVSFPLPLPPDADRRPPA
jgi:3',5'-cyclic AMP phosphodiesterase CpdA